MHAKNKTFQINHIHFFWTLIALIAISIFLYGYFVNVTILHTVSRQNVEDSIIEIKTDISQLEIQIIESNRNLTKEYAYNMGFSSVNELVFVERNNIASISLNEI